MKRIIFSAIFATMCGCAATPPPAAPPPDPVTADAEPLKPDPGNIRAFAELARTDLRLRKTVIVAQNLPLTEEEAALFWPIQRDYEQELSSINDRRLALVRQYFADGATMDDTEAKKLAGDVFDLEAQRTQLKRTYFDKFQAAVPAVKAARFFQIDNQLNMALDLQVAAALPLIK